MRPSLPSGMQARAKMHHDGRRTQQIVRRMICTDDGLSEPHHSDSYSTSWRDGRAGSNPNDVLFGARHFRIWTKRLVSVSILRYQKCLFIFQIPTLQTHAASTDASTHSLMCSRPTSCCCENYFRATRDISHHLVLTTPARREIEYSSNSTEIENWCNFYHPNSIHHFSSQILLLLSYRSWYCWWRGMWP